jgi:hypothetical protein
MHFRGRHPMTGLIAQLTQLQDVEEVRVHKQPSDLDDGDA